MLGLVSLFAMALLSLGQPIDRIVDINEFSAEEPVVDRPKWFNHCKATSESTHHLSHKFQKKSQKIIVKELLERVEKSALISLRRAEDIKKKFVEFEHIFDDFEDLKLESDFKWLPSVSPFSEQTFKDISREMAILMAHQYIEKFAVAFEQIVMDQNDRDNYDIYSAAIHKVHFKNIEDDNYSVLCEIRIAMAVEFGSVNQHFLSQTERTIMPSEDRIIGELSKRMLRDYLILRQYVKTTQLITKLFEYIRETL